MLFFHTICIINDGILDQYIVDGRNEENNPCEHELYGEHEAGLEKQLRVANMFHYRFDFEIKTERTQYTLYGVTTL